METKIEAVQLKWSEGCNIIVAQSHFIKTVEDVAEILVTAMPGIKYGIAFCEASGPRLVRTEGNAPDLVADAVRCANAVGAGHSLYVVIRDAFPINVLNQIKLCQEVAQVFCATANPLQVLVARTSQGAGIIGVIDGEGPLGVENDGDKVNRSSMLRKFGYKFC